MREDSPCKDCPERFLACSDHCPKDARGEYGYKAWKERYQAQQKHLNDNKYRMLVPMSEAREKASIHYTKHPIPGRKGGIQ
jgi:hypothetical protein